VKSSFSIVTLAKNDACGLLRTRRSVRNQVGSHAHHHIVVADSYDETEDIARQMGKEEGVTVWWDAPEGIYQAMNWILDRLNGKDQVWFLNSGDFFLHDSVIARMDLELTKSGHSWGTSGFAVVRESGKISNLQTASKPWSLQDVGHQATCIQVALLNEVGGFDTEYRVFADGKAIRSVMALQEPAVLEDYTVGYLEHGFSAIHPIIAQKELIRLNREFPIGAENLSFGGQCTSWLKAILFSSILRIDSAIGSNLNELRPTRSSTEQLAKFRAQNHWDHNRSGELDLACCLIGDARGA